MHHLFYRQQNRILPLLRPSLEKGTSSQHPRATIIETSVSFNLLSKDVDVSAKEMNRRLSLISNVDSSCAVDGLRLGLHKVVRVSPKTNSSSTAVVCGAFRSIFAAIALDTGDLDTAGNVFLTVHGRDLGFSMDM